MFLLQCFTVGIFALVLPQTQGHMALEEPPARNVLWRKGYDYLPEHVNDDYLVCAETPRYSCPPCGDPAGTPHPRPHQAGGKWANGIITKSYTMGQRIRVEVNITNSHGGLLEFRLCPHNNPKKPVDQSCLNQYPLQIVSEGSRKLRIDTPYGAEELLSFEVRLPTGITCDQCVLQMTSTAEQFLPNKVMFRNCADIAIQGSAKTNFAAGVPEVYSEYEIHTRSGFGPEFPEQKQYRFFD